VQTGTGKHTVYDMANNNGSTASAVAGGLASAALAYFRLNLMLVVLGGIAGVYLWNMLV